MDDLIKKYNQLLYETLDSGLLRSFREELESLGMKICVVPMHWNYPELLPKQSSFEFMSENFDEADPESMIDKSIEFMSNLVENYLDNMEGCDAKEFLYWESLHNAADTLLQAMIEEQKENQV